MLNLCDNSIAINSQAGKCTVVSVKRGRDCPCFNFDVGNITKFSDSSGLVFISHCHTDHVGASALHARARTLSDRTAKTTFYVTKGSGTALKKIHDLYASLDSGLKDDSSTGSIVNEVVHGDKVPLNKKYYMNVFNVNHRINAVGYCLFQNKQVLKKEYSGLPSNEIRALIEKGESIKEEVNIPEICYSGDATFESLVSSSSRNFILKSRVLIMELTFLCEKVTQTEAREKGHVHILDIVDFLESNSETVFENQKILFMHMSARYSAREICKIAFEKFSRFPGFLNKICFSFHAWGLSSEEGEELWLSVRDNNPKHEM